MPADDLLSALDPEQREVATALRGPVRVLAGAGTGKTRAITHRIAYGVASGVYNPMEVLAVTFTTRAAGEMRTRLRSMGASAVQARTFHSAALRQVRYFWPKVYGGQPPELTASKIPIVAGAARRNRVDVSQALLRDLASEIEWAKVSNVRPDDYERLAPGRGREVSGMDAGTVAHVFGSYEELKRDQGRMDMEDVLLIGAALLSEDERVAAEVHRQYKWFTVDEFQDVSPIQSALLDLWLGGRDEICVVGDPAQTIYSFAGARAGYLTEFPAKYPGAKNIDLVRNYRSTPQVIETANALLKDSATTSVLLRAQVESGAAVTWRESSDEVAEADAVAAEISRLSRAGVPLREMAVLFRINAQSESFEEALTAHGVAYVVRGAARFFERQEVRQALALLRGQLRAASATGDAVVEQVRAVLTGMGWSAQAPTARGQARDRWESLQALVAQATDYAESETAAGRAARPGRLRLRAGPPRPRAACSGGRGRDPGDAARGEGPGVGRRVPVRHAGRVDADHLRGHSRCGGGGAPAPLRGRHPGPPAPVDLVVVGPQPGWAGTAQAVALLRGSAAGVGHGPSRGSHRGTRLAAPRQEGGGVQAVPEAAGELA